MIKDEQIGTVLASIDLIVILVAEIGILIYFGLYRDPTLLVRGQYFGYALLDSALAEVNVLAFSNLNTISSKRLASGSTNSKLLLVGSAHPI
jgi:hypothetical protein